MQKLAALDSEAFAKYNAIKAHTLGELQKLIDDPTFIGVDDPIDPEFPLAPVAKRFPYSERIPGFVGDNTLIPTKQLSLFSGRFDTLEAALSQSLALDRTVHMRDFFLSSFGYSQYFGEAGKSRLQEYSGSTILTINGFTTTIKAATNSFFFAQGAVGFASFLTSVSSPAVLAFETVAATNASKILSNEIINDAAAKIFSKEKGLFEETLGFKGFATL